MTVTYRSELSVRGAIPGLSVALDTVALSLANLKTVAEAQYSALVSAATAVGAQASAVLSARLAIRIPATADLQAQLDASVAIGAQLTADLTDPSLYFSTLLAGLAEVEANIGLLVPSIALSAQIDASASVGLDMTAKLAAIDLQLDALLTISNALSVAAGALAAIRGALTAAIAATVSAVALYAQFNGVLGNAGVHGFLYTGVLANLGTELDAAVSADTGFSGALNVHVPLFVYDAADSGAVSGMRLAISQGGA